MNHTLIILVKNKGEELSRIFGLLRRLDFEIAEFTMKKAKGSELYQIEIVVIERSNGNSVEYLKKQLNKLINLTKIVHQKE